MLHGCTSVNPVAFKICRESTRIPSDINDPANTLWLKNMLSTNNTEKASLPLLKLTSCAELAK